MDTASTDFIHARKRAGRKWRLIPILLAMVVGSGSAYANMGDNNRNKRYDNDDMRSDAYGYERNYAPAAGSYSRSGDVYHVLPGEGFGSRKDSLYNSTYDSYYDSQRYRHVRNSGRDDYRVQNYENRY